MDADTLVILSSPHPIRPRPPTGQKREERGMWMIRSVSWSTEKGKEEWKVASEEQMENIQCILAP